MTDDDLLAQVEAFAPLLAQAIRGSSYPAVFRHMEKHGIHVTPVDFYQPIPDTRTLEEGIWTMHSELVGVEARLADQLAWIRDLVPQYRDEYASWPREQQDDITQFYLSNGMFDGMDAIVLYCMVRALRPDRIVEIGSGFSTRLASAAVVKNGRGEIVVIDPYLDEHLCRALPVPLTMKKLPVESVDYTFFQCLEAGDILFIDSSHVIRIGGDVNWLLLEILPRLKPGVVIHIHDVFFPYEYSKDWVIEKLRFWSEQYLLQAFLTFNTAFEIIVCNSMLGDAYRQELREIMPSSTWWGGGSLWIRRRTAHDQSAEVVRQP